MLSSCEVLVRNAVIPQDHPCWSRERLRQGKAHDDCRQRPEPGALCLGPRSVVDGLGGLAVAAEGAAVFGCLWYLA